MDPCTRWLYAEVMAASEPLRRSSTPVRVLAMHRGAAGERPDVLATEEPMEIRAAGPGQELQPVAVTMRTPGGDFELAVGFLFTEGLIGPGDVQRVAYCDNLPGEDQRYNVVSVRLQRPFDVERVRRNFYATSSCGICGKAALDDVEVLCGRVSAGPDVSADVVVSLPDLLRAKQQVFDRTGGLHAAGVVLRRRGGCSVDPRGRRSAQRGRQSGRASSCWRATSRSPGSILQVSGRLSFEIVQKARGRRHPGGGCRFSVADLTRRRGGGACRA